MRATKFFFAIVGILVISSCATMVPISVTVPAEIDMSDYRNITVMDFKFPSLSKQLLEFGNMQSFYAVYFGLYNRRYIDNSEHQFSTSLYNQVINSLVNKGYFNIINAKDIIPMGMQDNERNTWQADTSKIDAFLTGEITTFKIDRDYDRRKEKSEYGQTVTKTYVHCTLYVEFNYNIIDADDNRVIASNTYANFYEDTVIEDDMEYSINNLYSLAQNEIVAFLERQLMPYEKIEYRSLMEFNEEREDIESADALVKSGHYDRAYDIYNSVWLNESIEAAGYNAAIMLEAMGQISNAVSLLEDVYDIYPSPQTASDIKRLENLNS